MNVYYAWMSFRSACKDVYFPDQPTWSVVIALNPGETGWDEAAYIAVRSLDGGLYLSPRAPLVWTDGGRGERSVCEETRCALTHEANGAQFSVIFRSCRREDLRLEKYRMPRGSVRIGSAEQAEIRDESRVISREHGALTRMADGTARYRDDSSTNGTYLNGRRIPPGEVSLRVGDALIWPSGLKLVYLGECLAINRTPGTRREYRLERWSEPAARETRRDESTKAPAVCVDFPRPPRMLEKSETEDVELELPQARAASQAQPLLMQLGPSMTMVLPMLMGTVFAGRSGMMSSGLAMMGTSSALAVMWGVLNRKYRKKTEAEAEARRAAQYRKYIAETEEKLYGMNVRELGRLRHAFPDAAACAEMPAERSRELWNRMPSHPDFLTVRLGTGEVEMPCEITVPQQKMAVIDDELRSEPERLKATYSVMANAPVTLPLRREAVIGILGGGRALRFAQGMLMQIAALHSYHDVRIAVLTEESQAAQWRWARWLPHAFTSEDRELRMVAYTPDDIHEVVAHLDEVLTIRKDSAREGAQDDEDAPTPLPHYVIFCTDHRILEDEPIMRRLITNRAGMTLVMLGETMTELPKESHAVLNLGDGDEAGRLHFSEGGSRTVDFEYPGFDMIKAFSRSIAPIRTRDMAQGAAIPTLVSFLDVYGVRRVEELDVWRMWSENHTYDGLKSTIGYKAGSQPFVLDISDKYHGPHGLIAGTTGSGKSVMLETYILSLALNYSPRQVQFILIDYKGGGMADTFRELPHVAGIVDNLQSERVIDRALASLEGEIERREKIFKAVEVKDINEYTRQFGSEPGLELPHLIIIVDEFAELKSERGEFMAKLVKASRVGRSLGVHLILATQKPSGSVSDEIWTNARFHLCLRVQTTGDSNDMLKRPDAAYIKGMGRCFIQIGNDEIFEQVQTAYAGLEYRPDEPRPEELPQLLDPVCRAIRAPHAPEKGEAAEEAQDEAASPSQEEAPDEMAAQSPALSDESDDELDDEPEDGLSGERLQELLKRKSSEKDKKVTQMSAVIERIGEVAAAHGGLSTHRMWLKELPGVIELAELDFFRRVSRNGAVAPNPPGNVRIPVGLMDDVDHQRYLPFVVNLSQMRNLRIVGQGGTGKTTLIQTMVYALCSLYDPEHVQIYIVGASSAGLRRFPQVGDVLSAEETVVLKRLLTRLKREMERRKELFQRASTDNFAEYNRSCASSGKKPEPAVIVFIDGYQKTQSQLENDEESKEILNEIIREGSARGVHLVATCIALNEIPTRDVEFFQGIGLQLTDASAYRGVIGAKGGTAIPMLKATAGRGVGMYKGRALEFQIARAGCAPKHLGGGFERLVRPWRLAMHTDFSSKETFTGKKQNDEKNEKEVNEQIAGQILEYAAALDEAWMGDRPAPVPRLPEHPGWREWFAWPGFDEIQRQPFQIPVGFDVEETTVAAVDVAENPGWLVCGVQRSGVTNLLKLIARAMKARGADVVVLGDAQWRPFAQETGVELCVTPQEIAGFLDRFRSQYVAARKPLREAALEKGAQAARVQAAMFRPLCLLVDDALELCKCCENMEYRQSLPLLWSIPDLLATEINQKPYYNISLFVGISRPISTFQMPTMLKAMVEKNRVIALGGRLDDFDPCDLRKSLPAPLRNKALPAGHGYIGFDRSVRSIVVPLADGEAAQRR